MKGSGDFFEQMCVVVLIVVWGVNFQIFCLSDDVIFMRYYRSSIEIYFAVQVCSDFIQLILISRFSKLVYLQPFLASLQNSISDIKKIEIFLKCRKL